MPPATADLRLPRWAGFAALGLSVAIWLLVLTLAHQPFHVGPRALRYFDLKIYVAGARRVLDGVALYATPIRGPLGFTYPPFSAMLIAPLAELPFGWVAGIVTVINLVLLLIVLRLALRIGDGDGDGREWTLSSAPPRRLSALSPWSWAALAAAVAIWWEPVSVTLGYGQINLLVAALVVGDLARPDRARSKGAAVGLAAAIKLTPLLFLVYLAVSGRRRAATVGSGVFAATIALAFAVAPGDASAFWGNRILHASGVGGPADASDQSLRGLIARLGVTGSHLGAVWLVASVVVVCVTLGLARIAVRRGDEATAYSLVAIATLLVSPISWTHHWTLVAPAVMLLARRAWTRRSVGLGLAAAALVVLGCAYLPDQFLERHPPSGAITLLTSDEYVLAGLVVVAACGMTAVRTRRRAGDERRLRPAADRGGGRTMLGGLRRA